MKLSAVAALAALGTAVSGCATIVEGTTQSVSVNTAPVIGAQCTLINSQGTWYITSPGNAVVHRTKTDLDVTCQKEGYQPGHVVAISHFAKTTAANVILGGAAGVAVDMASGANFYYDTPIFVPLGAKLANGQITFAFPVAVHCSNPSLRADVVPDGPQGYVTATVKFDVNSSADAGAVNVTSSQDGVCTVAPMEGTSLTSASFTVADSWTGDGQPFSQHVDIVQTAPDAAKGGAYTFRVRAKDKTESKVTLKFPISYR
ncbi:MAG: hypothetical protein ACJ8EL_10980 [Rhizomicrobium sp.]|jgi:hypothetical protein